MLLSREADNNQCNNDYQLPLMLPSIWYMCSYINSDNIVREGSRLYQNNVRAPIMSAREYGNTEMVMILLNKGSDFHKCSIDGQLPLILACRHGQKEIVRMLSENGVDCDKYDKKCWSSVMVTFQNDNTEIVRMLLDRGAHYDKCNNYESSLHNLMQFVL
ncbi:unnamed protein product [Mytilus coruscus]|uniref:Uncharacterized protein n=1 Tax=Mytilus coruscus TaxID=42192 RepID=A0A6J8EGB5_MYTCO|nr:unnamed protein product [Mytilus coruscus]